MMLVARTPVELMESYSWSGEQDLFTGISSEAKYKVL